MNTQNNTKEKDCRACKVKIFMSGPSHRKYTDLGFSPLEWLRFTPSISVSASSRYHWHPEFSTTGSSEDFTFALIGLGALQSPLWLHFNSSSCLYLSTSLLFLAFVPESQDILLVRIPRITFLLSSTACFLRTCSQGSKMFSAQGALLLHGCTCQNLASSVLGNSL